jgi:peptidoglycan/xylan/chitin deacetylase (PgdA/CDA1 family)
MKGLLKSIKYEINKFLRRDKPLILCYHSISRNDMPFPVWTHMNCSQFEQHLRFLSGNFRCISLPRLYDQLEQGEFEPYSIVITFDDGYRNNFTDAFPLLIKYNVPATIFITTSLTGTNKFIWSDAVAAILSVTELDQFVFDNNVLQLSTKNEKGVAYRKIVDFLKGLEPKMITAYIGNLIKILGVSEYDLEKPELQTFFGHLSWGQIHEMVGSGLVDIGSHGLSHSILARLPEAKAREEIKLSKSVLEEGLAGCGYPVKFFAYPNGGASDFTEAHHAPLMESCYHGALTTIPDRVNKLVNPYELPRVCIGNEFDLDSLRYIVTH